MSKFNGGTHHIHKCALILLLKNPTNGGELVALSVATFNALVAKTE